MYFYIYLSQIIFLNLHIYICRSQHSSHNQDNITHSNRINPFLLAPFIYPQLYKCLSKPIISSTTNISHSQAREDLWLYDKIFSDLGSDRIIGKTFLEIGGLDGLLYTNTLYFEENFDWRGILVEGHPHNQVLLRKNIDEKHLRRNVAIFTNAICPIKNYNEFSFVNFTTRGGAVGAALNTAHKMFLNQWHPKDDATGIVSTCLPLQVLIDSTGLVDIDLFSLDVEGAELFVLETINFRITNIRVIVVELDGHDEAKNQKVRELLKRQAYVNANKTLGDIRSYCYPNEGCTTNEVFINPRYEERAKARKFRKKYYKAGTSTPCEM